MFEVRTQSDYGLVCDAKKRAGPAPLVGDLAMVEVVTEAGPDPVLVLVLETTWGWYWDADVITGVGGRVHLAHPLGIKGFENRRAKNDLADATLLADLLRIGTPNRGVDDDLAEMSELSR